MRSKTNRRVKLKKIDGILSVNFSQDEGAIGGVLEVVFERIQIYAIHQIEVWIKHLITALFSDSWIGIFPMSFV